MTLDVVSLQTAASLVILVSAAMYLLDTLMLKDGLPGRLWASGFLSGFFSALCYLIWLLLPEAFVGLALGNAAFVAATGFIWLGCVAFNGRGVRTPVVVLCAALVVVSVWTLVEGSTAEGWAGAVPLYLANAMFAVLGAIETRRGAIGRRWSAAGLTVVLGVEAVWFVVRTGVFVVLGPDSELFRSAFDTHVASLLTITLVVAAVVVTSVLRTNESALRGTPETYELTVDRNGVLLRESFRATLTSVIARAHRGQEEMCVLCVRIDDLRRVATAYGPAEAEAIAGAFRSSVRLHAPLMAIVGQTDTTGLAVAFTVAPTTDVRRTARVLHERVTSDLSALGMSVVPVVGIGVSLVRDAGFDAECLIERADAAAAHAADTGEQPFGLTGR